MRGDWKLRLAPLWPALAAVVAMTAALGWRVPPLFERATGEELLDALSLVETAVGPALDGDRGDLQRRAVQLATGTSLRITVIRPDGRVLADSDRTPAEVGRMDDHSGRPEVAAALAGGRGSSVRTSATTRRQYVYAARRYRSPAGRPYVLRLAEPLEELAEVRRRLASAVALALLVTLAAIAASSIWLDRRLFRPLAELIAGASGLAARGGGPRGRVAVPAGSDARRRRAGDGLPSSSVGNTAGGPGRRGPRLPLPAHGHLAELAAAVNRMTERVESEAAQAAAERDQLRTILASMSEGVLVVDGEGRAVLANPAFRRLFELPGEVAGRLPFEIARRPELATLIQRTLAAGAARLDELVLDQPGGRRTVALAGAALRRENDGGPGADGRAAGAVVAARDTSELTRLARARSDFVANVSHELKTPLSAIRGLAETLRDGALEDRPTAGRFTARILEQCRRLQELLDDLLTLSRLESVEVSPERRPVDPVRLVECCVETVAPRAAEREVEIAWRPPPAGALPPRLEADRNALERLLLNLLDNALKYTPAGGRVEVRLHAAEAGEAPGLVLEVADTGIGIPAGELPRIFERFYRVDKGRARDEGGTGLGLAIVKHVAQAHGGRVEVTSNPGQGSTFRVHLPAR